MHQRMASTMFDLPHPFGPDDAEHIVVEMQDGSVDERLEADELELLDLHPPRSLART